MRIPQEVKFALEDNRVIASLQGEVVGELAVEEIAFQWCRDLVLPLGGIASVGTAEPHRGLGIGATLMQRAHDTCRSRGYACSAVSTGATNPARRLYTRAGCQYLFSTRTLIKDVVAQAAPRHGGPPPPGTAIRGYQPGDEHLIAALRRQVYGDYFGCMAPDADRWLAKRANILRADPESTLIAFQGGEAVGYADYCEHWPGVLDIVGNVCVAACPDRHAVAVALLRRLESRLAAAGTAQLKLSVAEHEPFLADLFESEGYRTMRYRAVHLHVLDLDALLQALRPAFARRLRESQVPDWSGTVSVGSEARCGAVALGEDPEIQEIALSVTEPILTQVLCGTLSAWEAYLRGLLDVRPRPFGLVAATLQALLPAVPFCHPIDEWW